jgi:hypothetical protein
MKKTLLIAAAALAAGIITSQAQPVYSQNIVGYVNVQVKAGEYSLLANPLDVDGTNQANNVISRMVQDPSFDDSVILTFTGGHYAYYQYDQATPGWLDQNGLPTTTPVIPPGTGFFFNNAGPTTNLTFTGTVVPLVGKTNTIIIPSGTFVLIGSALPVGGTPGDGSILNFPRQDGFSQAIETFVGGHYQYYSYDGGWVDQNDNPTTTPVLTVGQGFFFANNGSPTNWVQTYPGN